MPLNVDKISTGSLSVNGNEITSGAGIMGSQYIFVSANGTPTENATELQVAYDKAKTMSPSQPNRITIICGPGKYEFPNSSPFTLDTAFIDLVSLTGNRDVFLYTTSSSTNLTTDYNIDISTDNVFVKGVDATTEIWVDLKGPSLLNGSFNVSDDLSMLVCENCQGGNNSFSPSFGTVSGTFTNCAGGINSFGIFGTASGTFTNCVGGDSSFGAAGTASGTFTNCVGGDSSFGAAGTLSGKLFYCRLTTGTFNTVSGGGKTLYCIDGNNDPNNQGFTPQNIV